MHKQNNFQFIGEFIDLQTTELISWLACHCQRKSCEFTPATAMLAIVYSCAVSSTSMKIDECSPSRVHELELMDSRLSQNQMNAALNVKIVLLNTTQCLTVTTVLQYSYRPTRRYLPTATSSRRQTNAGFMLTVVGGWRAVDVEL